jgi:hypothetical protein
LPNNGHVQGLVGFGIPRNHGFSLVGDGHSRWGFWQFLKSFGEYGLGSLPNLTGIVLNPPGLGEVLGNDLLMRKAKLARGV